MKNLFIILFTLLSTIVLGETYFEKSVTAIKHDYEAILDGKSTAPPQAYVQITEKANKLIPQVHSNKVTEEEAFSIIIEIYLDQEGLHVTKFAEIVDEFRYDLELLKSYYSMSGARLEFQLNGWIIPARVDDRFTAIKLELRSKTQIIEQERNRTLVTKNSMVQEVVIDGQRYQIINTTDDVMNITAASPGGENLRGQSGFCPGNRPNHTAVDISQGLGSIVYAIFSGYVTRIYDPNGLGCAIAIYSPQFDVTIVYAHFGDPSPDPAFYPFLVKNGEYVNAGEPIGREGYTGHVRPSCKECFGNHTHIILVKGTWKWGNSNVLNLEACMPTFKKSKYFDGSIIETMYLKETNGKHGRWSVISEDEFLKAQKSASEIEIAFMNK